MKKIIIITSLIALVLGSVLTISGFFVYKVVKLQSQVAQNTTAINQIVQFLNGEIAKNNSAQAVK
jgi:hypothetical protein